MFFYHLCLEFENRLHFLVVHLTVRDQLLNPVFGTVGIRQHTQEHHPGESPAARHGRNGVAVSKIEVDLVDLDYLVDVELFF